MLLVSPESVAQKLNTTRHSGEGLSAPYARKWENAGCAPLHSLWTWPSDRVLDFSKGLLSLGAPITEDKSGVRIQIGDATAYVSINRSAPGDGTPDAYFVRFEGADFPVYIGNSPEVVVEILRMWDKPLPQYEVNDLIEVGFPGQSGDITYVGSWQWGIHGEVRTEDDVRRAAAATLVTIRNIKKGV